MFSLITTCSLAALLSVSSAWAQQAAPTCEQQVQEQYQQLTKDKLLPEPPLAEWAPQLTAMVSQLRIRNNQYELKKNQAEFYEQEWMRAAEQLRLARKGAPKDTSAPAPPSPAPTN